MPFRAPVIEVRFLLKLGERLSQNNTTLPDLLRDLGLNPCMLDDTKAVILLSAVGRIFDRAAKVLNDPVIGLHMGETAPPGSSGLIGHMMLSCATVRDMLNVLADYHEVHIRNIDARFEETEAVGKFTFSYPAEYAGARVHYTAFAFAALASRIRLAAGAAWMPLGVEFDHRTPEGVHEYERVFGPRLKFGQANNVMVVDTTTLSKRLPPMPEGMFETVRELGDRVRAETRRSSDLPTRIHREISNRLAGGEVFDLEGIAAAVALSPRALQYRLEQHRTSYENILVETRRSLAVRYLRDTDLPMTEISARLGFSEPSAFTRASRKWFRASPRDYRQRMRAAIAAE